MKNVMRNLPGQLTSSVHFSQQDEEMVKELLPIMTQLAGRVVANAFPTGVEVNSAIHHGGPFPATTDARSSSVGTSAILRFVRPVCFQGFPKNLLPDDLRS
jgi:NADP-dependent aldehyde dehydrogenase